MSEPRWTYHMDPIRGSVKVVDKDDYDVLRSQLAEAKDGFKECMDDHATTLERLDEAEALLRDAKTAVILHRPHALVVGRIDAFLARKNET